MIKVPKTKSARSYAFFGALLTAGILVMKPDWYIALDQKVGGVLPGGHQGGQQ